MPIHKFGCQHSRIQSETSIDLDTRGNAISESAVVERFCPELCVMSCPSMCWGHTEWNFSVVSAGVRTCIHAWILRLKNFTAGWSLHCIYVYGD